jgi:hypothetical protein
MYKFVITLLAFVNGFCIAGNYGTIVISELMPDPSPSTGLPEVEYIEIYNRSDKPINLAGWRLQVNEKQYPFASREIPSKGYLLVCQKNEGQLFDNDINKLELASFPALNNSGSVIHLRDSKNDLIFVISYDESWYKNKFKSKGGWSLECIDTDNLSGLSNNWKASENIKGGTPGRANSVENINPDILETRLQKMFFIDDRSLELCFNKMISSDVDDRFFRFVNGDNIVTEVVASSPDYKNYSIKCSDNLSENKVYSISIRGLEDISGIPVRDTLLKISLPQKADSFCLSINEVMFNPTEKGFDYVEIVNRSEKCIDLSDVWITNYDESGDLNEGSRLSEKFLPCMPGSYWLVSNKSDSVFLLQGLNNAVNGLDVAKMPSMPDDKGNVLLLNGDGIIIDRFTYDNNMHYPLLKDAEGVSLEKINPDLSSVETGSWLSASESSGFCTPGFINSQFRNINTESDDIVFYEKTWFTPDNDGNDDAFLLTVKPESGGVLTIGIYDIKGIKIKALKTNSYIGAEENIVWNGEDEKGQIVKTGKYICQVLFYSAEGKIHKKRFVINVL